MEAWSLPHNNSAWGKTGLRPPNALPLHKQRREEALARRAVDAAEADGVKSLNMELASVEPINAVVIDPTDEVALRAYLAKFARFSSAVIY